MSFLLPAAPGRVFIGWSEQRHATNGPGSCAIEVPSEHIDAWLAATRAHKPDAYISQMWTNNGTVMARYRGTPADREELKPGEAP